MNNNYKEKYQKYKQKYLNLKNLVGGAFGIGSVVITKDLSKPDYNGLEGIIINNLIEGRYNILVTSKSDNKILNLNIKPEKISEISDIKLIQEETRKLFNTELIGKIVQIHSIVSAPQFNGLFGIIVDMIIGDDLRLSVKFSFSDKNDQRNFKPENLNIIDKASISPDILENLNYLLLTTEIGMSTLKALINKPNSGAITFHNQKISKKVLLKNLTKDEVALRTFGYTNTMAPLCNIALISFSINFIVHVMEVFNKFYSGVKHISIGSGVGLLEFMYERQTGQTILCIDPDPMKWTFGSTPSLARQFRPLKIPEYPTVDELIRIARPESCTLLLNWCYPGEEYGSYDLDAILKLNPLAFLVIFEQFGKAGTAGSIEFHRFLRRTTTYKCVHLICLDKSKKNINIQWWQKVELPLPEVINIPDVVESLSINFSVEDELRNALKMKEKGTLKQAEYEILIELIANHNYSIDEFAIDYEERRLTLEQIKRKVTKK
jgi:hypothetical protein